MLDTFEGGFCAALISKWLEFGGILRDTPSLPMACNQMTMNS
jgi:hypothetical protein